MSEVPEGRRRRPPSLPQRPVLVASLRKADVFRHEGEFITVAKIAFATPVPGRLVVTDTKNREWPFPGNARVDFVSGA